MPNWCGNRVVIQGNRKTLQEIYRKGVKLKEEKVVSLFSFNNFFPIPTVNITENFSQTTWCSQNWGTNRDCFMEAINGHNQILSKTRQLTQEEGLVEDELELLFSTAWAPPINFFLKLSKQYNVTIRLHYLEAGMCVAGYVSIVDGYTDVEEDIPHGSDEYEVLMSNFIETGVAIG